MAFRRRRFRGGFRRRAPTQWVVNPGTTYWDCSQNAVAIPSCQSFPLELTGASAPATADPPSLFRYTIKRVVGDVLFQLNTLTWTGTAPDPLRYLGGQLQIRYGLQVVTGAVPSQPHVGVDGDDNFMLLGTHRITVNYVDVTNPMLTLGAVIFRPVSDGLVHIDTKVKRVIRPPETLQFVVQYRDNTDNGLQLGMKLWLRTLIGRVA